MYRITATAVYHGTDRQGVSQDTTHQVPTFYLDEQVQGITDAQHAEAIAKQVVCPMANDLEHEGVTVHAHAEHVHPEAHNLLFDLIGDRGPMFMQQVFGDAGLDAYNYLKRHR